MLALKRKVDWKSLVPSIRSAAYWRSAGGRNRVNLGRHRRNMHPGHLAIQPTVIRQLLLSPYFSSLSLRPMGMSSLTSAGCCYLRAGLFVPWLAPLACATSWRYPRSSGYLGTCLQSQLHAYCHSSLGRLRPPCEHHQWSLPGNQGK